MEEKYGTKKTVAEMYGLPNQRRVQLDRTLEELTKIRNYCAQFAHVAESSAKFMEDVVCYADSLINLSRKTTEL